MTFDDKKFGKKIKEIRHSLDMNEDKFAELLGLSSSHIHNIEAGRCSVSFDTFITIINVLDRRPDVLIQDNASEMPIYDAELNMEISKLTIKQISTITNAVEAFLSGVD